MEDCFGLPFPISEMGKGMTEMNRDPQNNRSEIGKQEKKNSTKGFVKPMKLANLFLEEEQIEAIKMFGSMSDFIRKAIDLRLAWEQVEDKQCPDLKELLNDDTARIADMKAHIEGCPVCKKRFGELLA